MKKRRIEKVGFMVGLKLDMLPRISSITKNKKKIEENDMLLQHNNNGLLEHITFQPLDQGLLTWRPYK